MRIAKMTSLLLLFAIVASCSYGNNIIETLGNRIPYFDQVTPPLFYSSCNTVRGRAVLMFAMGSRDGVFLETHGDAVISYAPVMWNGKSLSLDISNVNGGIYTYTVLTNRVEYLAKRNFSLSYTDVRTLLHVDPKQSCADKPPKD